MLCIDQTLRQDMTITLLQSVFVYSHEQARLLTELFFLLYSHMGRLTFSRNFTRWLTGKVPKDVRNNICAIFSCGPSVKQEYSCQFLVFAYHTNGCSGFVSYVVCGISCFLTVCRNLALLPRQSVIPSAEGLAWFCISQ